ncbi:MAG TPA: hypothetical protein VGC97_14585 [Pyrinomonadaceae bacterium]|jgi:hypothetical protein
MRVFLLSGWLCVFVCAASAQTHEQALEEFAGLKQKIEAIKSDAEKLEKIILQPESADLSAALAQGVNVFRLLPREKYDKDVFKVRGGGAFYSFTSASHSYDSIPQIGLDQNLLSVGFYGASYGFLTDLGEIPLANIDEKTKAVEFLASYQPPLEESKARIENTKGRGFQTGGIAYKNNLPAVAGHSYVVRAISYDEADALVAFRVQRKDADGSLIIFWKLLENFEKPKLIRDRQTASIVNSNFISADSPGSAAKIEAELRKKGFNQVSVDVSTTPLTLRGTVPKGKMAEVVQLAQDVTKKPVRVELTEK